MKVMPLGSSDTTLLPVSPGGGLCLQGLLKQLGMVVEHSDPTNTFLSNKPNFSHRVALSGYVCMELLKDNLTSLHMSSLCSESELYASVLSLLALTYSAPLMQPHHSQ